MLRGHEGALEQRVGGRETREALWGEGATTEGKRKKKGDDDAADESSLP